MGGALRRFFTTPWQDVWQGLDRTLAGGIPALLTIGAGLLVGWWLYVPLHELLHALGCLLAGGTVSRLEIDRLYGGELFAAIFPFVTAGSEYAGRLSGFDTGGSDLVYLATDLAPFLLTIFPGVYLLRRAGQEGRPLLYGLALPVALAPFLSLTGDAYEIGSILTTKLPAWRGAAELLRGDDITRVATAVVAATPSPWGGLGVGFLIGLLWAFAVYAAGSLLASLVSHGGAKALRTRKSLLK